ncbi:hypothetical protein L332_03695 [Agrococcus pavilionensis RW1]|uniref:Uncharacterized protein n=1 Tax=Agrococcus pavilionensis RW1 TaxID=1330458 RepID=U1MSB5_9MICO|nr:hypothetical protein [Agrococcus pavilionensis]ERG63555.1 hypothetical protein L332_03695 [Agrococcus pavilionensis RW1]
MQGVALRAVTPLDEYALEPGAQSPPPAVAAYRWDSSEHVRLDAYRWDGAHVPVTPVAGG